MAHPHYDALRPEPSPGPRSAWRWLRYNQAADEACSEVLPPMISGPEPSEPEQSTARSDWEGSLNQTQSPEEDYRRGDEVGGTTTWNSLNYDEFVNDAAIAASQHWTPRRRRVCFGFSGRTLARWVVTCAIGVTMGALIACFLENGFLSDTGGVAIALAAASDALLVCRDALMTSGSMYGAPFCIYVAWGAVLGAAAAALAAFVAPGASGPGIPQVKAYLNGVRLEAFLSVRVFFVKLVGTALTVGSGASLGPEGPLVHLGAISGSFFTGGLDPTRFCIALRRLFPRSHELGLLPLTSVDLTPPDAQPHASPPPPPFFRNDVDRRDFLSIGAACGFSAAFGAPIGGVLFSLEEASSFWSNQLLWRSLVGAVLSTFTALALKHGVVGLHEISHYGLISLRGKTDASAVSLALVPVAVVFGVCGGVLGAGFNAFFYRIMRLRQRLAKYVEEHCAYDEALGKSDEEQDTERNTASIQQQDTVLKASSAKAAVRVADATLGIVITSLVFYGTALASRSWACVDRHQDDDGWLSDDKFVRKFNCDDGQVHELASLWFGNREGAIKKILEASPGDISASAFALSGLLTLATLALSFGSALPGGLFLPLIFCGASLGAAVANLAIVSSGPFHITRRHMGLLGAVALLAGVQRSTVSLCVIILEGTGTMNLLIPIILVACMARFVGNSLGEGLYELALKLQSIPFLERHVHASHDAQTVAHVFGKKAKPTCLSRRATVAQATQVLATNKHGAYPVVDQPESDAFNRSAPKLLGLVLREHVEALRRASHLLEPDADLPPALATRLASYAFDSGSTRISDDFQQDENSCTELYLDLERVMIRSPHVVYEDCPVARAYRLFVTMGARHLLVINHDGDLVGILTRHDMHMLTHHDP